MLKPISRVTSRFPLSAQLSPSVVASLQEVAKHTEENKAWIDRLHDEAKIEDRCRTGLALKAKQILKQMGVR